jgi:DNA-binding response OmpR family regulator
MRVLLVEDDTDVSLAIYDALTFLGYFVTVAKDGLHGLEIAKTNPFSAIILDRMLPGMEGVELCAAIRKYGITTPILMLTAKDSVADRVAGLDAGADDYLGKPFELSELLARLRALDRRESAIKGAILTAGELSVDTANKIAKVGGTLLNLSGREFALLEALTANASRVMTRESILERVWCDDTSTSNIVDVYVKTLRQKLAEAGAQPLIHTVHGLGYMLRTE